VRVYCSSSYGTELKVRGEQLDSILTARQHEDTRLQQQQQERWTSERHDLLAQLDDYQRNESQLQLQLQNMAKLMSDQQAKWHTLAAQAETTELKLHVSQADVTKLTGQVDAHLDTIERLRSGVAHTQLCQICRAARGPPHTDTLVELVAEVQAMRSALLVVASERDILEAQNAGLREIQRSLLDTRVSVSATAATTAPTSTSASTSMAGKESSDSLLKEVLDDNSRKQQALTTLGQAQASLQERLGAAEQRANTMEALSRHLHERTITSDAVVEAQRKQLHALTSTAQTYQSTVDGLTAQLAAKENELAVTKQVILECQRNQLSLHRSVEGLLKASKKQ
jgi:hypothetical protein